ncbi:MAG: hypothetical protein FWD06_06970 [Oscillospiraceae bacterium]|nr:hypothetical protein [Oscillospiraceae bacterium]
MNRLLTSILLYSVPVGFLVSAIGLFFTGNIWGILLGIAYLVVAAFVGLVVNGLIFIGT